MVDLSSPRAARTESSYIDLIPGAAAVHQSTRRAEVEAMEARRRLTQTMREVSQARKASSQELVRLNTARAGARVRSITRDSLGKTLTESLMTVPPAPPSLVRELAEKCTRQMEDLFKNPESRTWYHLYKMVDQDSSGMIAFRELEGMVRHLLHIPHDELSENDLRSVWRSLDINQSGHITSGEFSRFMRMAESGGSMTWRETLRSSVGGRAESVRQLRQGNREALELMRHNDLQSRTERARREPAARGPPAWVISRPNTHAHIQTPPVAHLPRYVLLQDDPHGGRRADGVTPAHRGGAQQAEGRGGAEGDGRAATEAPDAQL